MKKLFAALLFVCAAVALHGQSIFVPGGINYGGGLTIKETQGTGAPSPSCSGFVRYWQTDAATSPMWECLNGSMVNIGIGSGGSGTSFAVTTTATGLQSLTGAFQAPNIFVGSTDTNISRCGTTCLGLGSAAGTVNGTFKALNITGNNNGVLNPTLFTGSDIGAKVNAAFATLTSSGTVRIPAGTYSFSTTIHLPADQYHLQCDAGATLTYTGTGTAIAFPNIAGASRGTNVLGIDGDGGCSLLSSTNRPSGSIGVLIPVTNGTYITGMRINGFDHDIDIEGGNTVEIWNNKLDNANMAVYTNTISTTTGGTGNYSPNAVHMTLNHLAVNGWGFYSHNGGGPITRELGTVIRDNTFEGNTTGDIQLGWDAHTVVEGNYFESNGVGVSAGVFKDNLYDIHINRNYFTNSGYRSNIEIGNGFGFYIEGNYEEGTSTSTHCAVNTIHDPNGGYQGLLARNAFSRWVEGGVLSASELCDSGTGVTSYNSTNRISGSQDIAGVLIVDQPGFHLGPDTQNNGSFPVGYIGGVPLFMARFDPAGTCGPPPDLWLTPDGLYVCQGTSPTATNGTWTKK
jgi:hypothetical protein